MQYKINEIFHSLQGEGYNQGREVIFIRLSGCNLACDWCDTDHISGDTLSVEQILLSVQQYSCKSIIITGGEPSIHNLQPLLTVLKEAGYWIAIESNGTNCLDIYGHLIDYISISPKSVTIQKKADEVRVVNDNLSSDDLLVVEKQIVASNYFISPLEQNDQFNIKSSIQLLGEINAVSNKHWSISLQMHKLSGIR